jgi:hypothetical protein
MRISDRLQNPVIAAALLVAALMVSACQSTQNFVKPDYDPAAYDRDHSFCVKVAEEPKQNPTIPSVPCVGCPVYGSYFMQAFQIIINNATGTTINQTTYGDCMRQSGYAAVPMTEDDWIEFNGLQSYDEKKKFLLALLKKAQQQQGP